MGIRVVGFYENIVRSLKIMYVLIVPDSFGEKSDKKRKHLPKRHFFYQNDIDFTICRVTFRGNVGMVTKLSCICQYDTHEFSIKRLMRCLYDC